MSKDEEITDGKASPDDIVATLAENTPHLPTSISKRSFMDDAYLEDGPLFRATIKQLEDRTSQLKQSLKRIIKSASAALDIRRQLSRADETYYEALREMQCAEPLMSHYLNHACHIIQQERTRLDQSLYSQMLTPLRQIYEQDIKMAELKRRQFEEESKDYYASLAKYLKSKKKSTEEEQKKQQQRKNRFDLARFDYLGFLLDVHGGRKENDILFCITDHTMRDLHYYESIAAKIEPEKPGLDQLVSLMTANALEQELATNERAAKRKELLCNIDNVDQQLKQAEESSDESAVVAAAAAPAIPELNFSHQQQQHSSNEDVMFKGIRDMEQQRDQVVVVGRKKEGFLFATAKPSKSTGGFDVTSSSVTWHKYWCVLSGGQLHEYSNWKRQLEPHIDPINLRFATVREARNAERRFCFEVITPHMRRIYQATSEEEAQSWIGTIHNSIESVLNGTSASSANLFDRGAAAAAAAAAVSPTATTSTTKRHARSLSGAFKNGFAAVAAATSSTAANQGAGVMTSPSQSSSSSTTTTPKDRTSKRQSALHHSHTNTTAADGNTPSEGAELLVSASSSPNDRFRWSGFSFGSHHDKHNGTNKLSSIQQSSNNNGNYVFSSLPDSEANTRLLSILREDASNHYCVDCGAKNPDWCSLNLGVLLCIECSGIHRSLGTHISKIRSLTLDSTSYTPDIVELLKSIGNARSNAIWDARFEKTTAAAATTTNTTTLIPRPNPTDSRAIKLAYIQAKYVGRQFVKKPSKHDSQLTADELLFEAIDQDDIPKALLALASGANVNSSRPDSIKSPRISLLLPSPDQQQQQQHQHAAQKFLPFLMDLDDESSKKLQVQEDNDDTQEVDGHYIVRYALHYALLHGREATSDELFYPSPLVLQSNSSIKTNTTETGGDASSILSTSSENAQATSISPRKIIFPMAEFLLQNGADTGIVDPETGLTLADLVGMGSIVNDNAIAYISIKNTARGQSAITRSSTILNQHLLSLQQQSIKEKAAAAAAAAASSKNKSTEDLSRIEEASVDDIPPPLPPRKDNPAPPPHVDQ